ncbi:hypothetical protein FJY63_00270 [Candidatus Sumerlaeota bacterium]|nr:hypothetical protein [Candidatus Sumerlaeota bacterium]
MRESYNEHAHTCSCISRRNFLGAMTAGAAATMVGCSRFGVAPRPAAAGDVIDLAAMRPRPAVRIMGAVVRRTPPYWLGWPGTSYPLEQKRQQYSRVFSAAARKVGIAFEEQPEPIESPDAAAAFIKKIEAAKPQAVLIHLQHINEWPTVGNIVKAGIPTIIFAPIGMAFTGHVLRISRQPGVHVISSLETRPIAQAFRMVRAKRQFEETRLLVVRGNERKEETLPGLGMAVRYVPRVLLEQEFDQTPETEEAHEVARERFRGAEKIVEPSRQDGVNAGRSFVAAKRLLKKEGCNALTTDCLGMVRDAKVPTPPCMAASIFQDTGVTYGCEAAVPGAMSLMLTSYLLDKPGFMNDPVPETVKNTLIVAHCVCGTRLNGLNDDDHEPYVLRSHSESNIGVSLQVLWRKGQRATLVTVQNPKSVIIDTGTVVGNVQTPPAGGCRTSVELAMDNVEDARDVLGFHQVVIYGDHRRDIEAFCQMYGMDVVHSPEKPPAPVGQEEKKPQPKKKA